MAVAVITGSAGLIGAEAARFSAGKGLDIVGIDNDMRRQFFGDEASTAWNRRRLETEQKMSAAQQRQAVGLLAECVRGAS
jgi:CDP-paratose 2-epimerase